MNTITSKVASKQATFAAGCFWGVEALFDSAKGVLNVKSGYTGGTKVNPTYHSLADHTEAVDIQYDPQQTNYENLLQLFWSHHDPTILHKRQYMSAIFYHDDEQKNLAELSKAEVQKNLAKPIVTQILKASTFYDAEEYHQKYYKKNNMSSCSK